MSTVTSAVTTCPDIQAGIEESFGLCDYNIDPITLLPYLYSQVNRSGIQMLVSPTFAKTRELLMVYDQIISDSEVTTISTCAGNCTATTKRGDLSQAYVMDCDGFKIEEVFDPADWRLSCKNNLSVIYGKILKMIAALDNRISKSVVSEVSGLMGAWAAEVDTDGNTLVVQTMASATQPNPMAWEEVDLALSDTNYCKGAFITGGSALYSYNRLMEAGCCASTGLNLGDIFSLYGKVVTRDVHVQAAVGKFMSWALMPGAVQLLTLNMNGGSEQDLPYINVGMGAGDTFAGVINSPYTGLPYDLTISYVCREIHIILEGRVKAVGAPLDMFPASHRMDGVTYVGAIQVSN